MAYTDIRNNKPAKYTTNFEVCLKPQFCKTKVNCWIFIYQQITINYIMRSKYLTPYLGFNLKIKDKTNIINLDNFYNHILPEEYHDKFGKIGLEQILYDDYLKIILKPLSDFRQIKDVKDFIGLGKWCDAYDDYFHIWFDNICNIEKLILQCPYELFQYFLSEHYDVFDLIKFDLAISIHDVGEAIS